MTFSYTDEQLNNLNRDYAVYSVNLEFAKRNGRTYVNSNLIENISPDNLEKTNTITTSDGQEFRQPLLMLGLNMVDLHWKKKHLLKATLLCL